MTDINDLLGSLRQRFEHPHPRPVGSLVNPDGPEAAEIIESLASALETVLRYPSVQAALLPEDRDSANAALVKVTGK